jgi:Phage integrase family
VPVGKLRNDRYLPLHPVRIDLLDAWRADNPNDDTGRLITDGGRPLDRHRVGPIVHRVGRAAGIATMHPHQLRHTLATQAAVCARGLYPYPLSLSVEATRFISRRQTRCNARDLTALDTRTRVQNSRSARVPTLDDTARGSLNRQLGLEP